MTAERTRGPWKAALLGAVLFGLPLLLGCAGRVDGPGWGPRWPSAETVRGSAVSAARSPAIWLPLAGAAVLAIGDLDEDVSSWAADERPLFGSDAADVSDHLRDAAEAAWLVTALAAPSDRISDKAGGLAVGAATLMLERELTVAIKDLTDRQRPDGSNDASLPSGHASRSAAAATLARRNLDYFALPGWADASLRVGLHGVALGTAWARVEAEKHHVTDVLVGHALGNFVAAFVNDAFMTPASLPLTASYRAVDGGGALTLQLALAR